MNIKEILKERFIQNMHRHPDVKWEDVEARLNDENLEILVRMEESGGEPDVVGISYENKIIFFDCYKECPPARANLCYDQKALESRKANKPKGSAVSMAQDMGVSLLNEDDYFHLQGLEDVDLKTSSWLHTPEDIRSKKGAIFGDKRFGRTFIYHNGAESYYSVRGFRSKLYI